MIAGDHRQQILVTSNQSNATLNPAWNHNNTFDCFKILYWYIIIYHCTVISLHIEIYASLLPFHIYTISY